MYIYGGCTVRASDTSGLGQVLLSLEQLEDYWPRYPALDCLVRRFF